MLPKASKENVCDQGVPQLAEVRRANERLSGGAVALLDYCD
jgi:hypothetical protein